MSSSSFPDINPFANGGSSYTQNRFQVGVRLPIASSLSCPPYYLLQSVNLPTGWDTNEIVGISLAFKIARKTRSESLAILGVTLENMQSSPGVLA